MWVRPEVLASRTGFGASSGRTHIHATVLVEKEDIQNVDM